MAGSTQAKISANLGRLGRACQLLSPKGVLFFTFFVVSRVATICTFSPILADLHELFFTQVTIAMSCGNTRNTGSYLSDDTNGFLFKKWIGQCIYPYTYYICTKLGTQFIYVLQKKKQKRKKVGRPSVQSRVSIVVVVIVLLSFCCRFREYDIVFNNEFNK